MCAIAGIFSPNPQDIQTMINAAKHRGPDDSGIFCDANLSLAHARLSIIDLDVRAKQPMNYKDRYTIVFNGEIYNYLELKTELKAKGYVFATKSDTEVIMASYDYWGKNALNKFNGMWAFAIYDKLKNELFLSRDRFGVKPLYYVQKDELFAFGSELKQFSHLLTFRLNKSVALDFLAFGILEHKRQTMLKDIVMLPAGHFCVFDLKSKKLSQECYYNLSSKKTALNTKDYSHEFLELLRSSIDLRLRSDVLVGSCLSGGLDSSSIVSLVAQKQNIQTITASYKEKAFDESHFARSVTDKFGLKQTLVYPDLDEIKNDEFFSHFAKMQDLPFGSLSIFAQYKVFETAKKNGIKVMLDGQGADEILGGYLGYFYASLASSLRTARFSEFLKSLQTISANAYNPSKKDLLINSIYYALPQFIKKLKPVNKPYLSQNPQRNMAYFGDASASVLSLSLAQILNTNLPTLLHYEDRNSMAHGVESRLPFLDYRLVEFTLFLPQKEKISHETKLILRNSMQGIAPEQVLNRKDKMGFVTPESLWAKNNIEFFKAYFKKALDCNIFTPSILQDLENFSQSKTPYNSYFWRLVSFVKWLETFKVDL